LNKDQAIGGVIILACVVIAILYVATLFFPGWLGIFGVKASQIEVRFWTIAVPVFVAFIAILGIGAWMDNGNNPSTKANRRNPKRRRGNWKGAG
jgi:amino acid transporter